MLTCLRCVSDDALRLRAVLESVQRNVHCSSQLFKLAQDAFKMATMPESTRHQPLLNAGFQLGLQVGWGGEGGGSGGRGGGGEGERGGRDWKKVGEGVG